MPDEDDDDTLETKPELSLRESSGEAGKKAADDKEAEQRPEPAPTAEPEPAPAAEPEPAPAAEPDEDPTGRDGEN